VGDIVKLDSVVSLGMIACLLLVLIGARLAVSDIGNHLLGLGILLGGLGAAVGVALVAGYSVGRRLRCGQSGPRARRRTVRFAALCAVMWLVIEVVRPVLLDGETVGTAITESVPNMVGIGVLIPVGIAGLVVGRMARNGRPPAGT
jgi:hypothetical protein